MTGLTRRSPRPQTAVVVFVGAAELARFRWLKPGFRHCFVALNDGRHWITVDPLAHQVEVAVQAVPAEFDIAAHYAAAGMTVVTAPVRAAPRRIAPVMPFTCVETVKRILGIHDRRVLTPWQLYRHITKKILDIGTKEEYGPIHPRNKCASSTGDRFRPPPLAATGPAFAPQPGESDEAVQRPEAQADAAPAAAAADRRGGAAGREARAGGAPTRP